jgi:hypothetical protein
VDGVPIGYTKGKNGREKKKKRRRRNLKYTLLLFLNDTEKIFISSICSNTAIPSLQRSQEMPCSFSGSGECWGWNSGHHTFRLPSTTRPAIGWRAWAD